jgi:hypothetical protein
MNEKSTHVWLVCDYQPRKVFASLESAKAMFQVHQPTFFEPEEGLIRVIIGKDKMATYSIIKMPVIS